MDNSDLHNPFTLHTLYQKGQVPLGQVPFNNLMMTVTQMANNNPQQPMQDEPLYVNAKQYHRILKRREARARQQATSRLQRKEKGKQAYMHESRHKHAMRRPRGPGGRFLSASEMAALEAQEKSKQTSPSQTISSVQDELPQLDFNPLDALNGSSQDLAHVALEFEQLTKQDFPSSTSSSVELKLE